MTFKDVASFKVYNNIHKQKQGNKNSRNTVETFSEVPSMLDGRLEIRISFSLQSFLLLQKEKRIALVAPESLK